MAASLHLDGVGVTLPGRHPGEEVVALENGVRGGQHAVDDAKIATAEFAHELG